MKRAKNSSQSLKERCKDFIEKGSLCKKTDKILLAVSGGVDSIVLANIIKDLGFNCAIAHCNFGLRGEDSDSDHYFTEIISKELDVQFWSKHFNTRCYAHDKGISIEMAARELRYQWFNELLEENELDLIATGHHADDQIETFFLNLIRGTGIAGLRGMVAKNRNIIRPLLFAYKDEIEKYAVDNKICWIVDFTNKYTDFKRNKIRHELITFFESLNPNFRKTMMRTIANLKKTEEIYLEKINDSLDQLLIHEDEMLKISIKELKSLNNSSTYLFEILSQRGFTPSTIEDINNSLNSISGKKFFSDRYRVIKDRNYLIILSSEIDDNKKNITERIHEDLTGIDKPLKLVFKRYKAKDFDIPDDPFQAALDYSKLTFPLTIRRWRQGDSFFPLGMTKKKKLSDFFADNKLSIRDKENIWVIESGSDIVYIAGYRIHNSYRVTNRTKEVYLIKMLK